MASSPIDQNDNSDDNLLSEINITPFVDVVLVLLVIFIITAPIIAKNAINVKLPKSSTKDTSEPVETLGIVITKQAQILLAGKLLDETTFETELKEKAQKNPEIQALLSADEDTKHKDIVHVMDLIKKAGINKFAFQIETKDNP